MKIAIIGGGIAGNVVAHKLHRAHEITVYEAQGHLGGHTHTHSVELAGYRYEVDTGFIVFNDRTYPNFTALLRELGVASQESSMSFSVRDDARALEYNGTTLNTLFAQRRNILRPWFLRMLRDILQFNRRAPALLSQPGCELPLGELLERGGYGRAFVEHYIVPMGAAIWSTSPRAMLDFPARFFVRFLHNHGMLSVNQRPVWQTVRGGAARYVEKLSAPWYARVRLNTPVQSLRRVAHGVIVKARGHAPARYDAAFVACHSDQALALLADASPVEHEVLGAIDYQRNEAVLHTDARMLPRRRLAWAAWNYRVQRDRPQVALTYNMNILQRLAAPQPLLVTLNSSDAIDPRRVIARMEYAHPLFTPAGARAQLRQAELNRGRRTYYCGAYWRNGFHEDGVVSALEALAHFRADCADAGMQTQ